LSEREGVSVRELARGREFEEVSEREGVRKIERDGGNVREKARGRECARVR